MFISVFCETILNGDEDKRRARGASAVHIKAQSRLTNSRSTA